MEKFLFYVEETQDAFGGKMSVFWLCPKDYFEKNGHLPKRYKNHQMGKMNFFLENMRNEGYVHEDEPWSFTTYFVKSENIQKHLIKKGILQSEEFTHFMEEVMWHHTLPGYYDDNPYDSFN